jgi:hypothetical protein
MVSKKFNDNKKRYGLQTIDNKISSVLKPLLNNSKKEFIMINNLVKNWSQIVGEKSAKFCTPKIVNLDKKTNGLKLTIAVYNPATGFFLEQNSEIIIERIAILYGFKTINKIIIKQEPKEINFTETEKTLTVELNNKIDKSLENIENKELSATLKKLAKEIFN